MKGRQQFEKWAKAEYYDLTQPDMIMAWEAWQAPRDAALDEAAAEIAKQRAAYPEDVFQHLANFREQNCFDCCAAAMALHTFSWLAGAVIALKEPR